MAGGTNRRPMSWGDVLGLASESLRLHRLRAGLTTTAIAIGVVAVLLLTALGEAAKGYVLREFSDIGTNLIMVTPGRVESVGMPAAGGATRDLTLEDGEAVRRQARAVRDVAPVSLGTGPLNFGGRTRTVYVVGVTRDYMEVRNIKMSAGQFVPAGDPRRGEGVVVIGPTIQREVFRDQSPLGQTLRIGQWRFRVIGVTAPRGHSLGFDFDDVAMVPIATAMRMFNQSSVFRLNIQAIDATSVEAAREQVRAVLMDRHDDEEDFTLITQDAMLSTMRQVIDALTAALAGIAAVSLAVAGIGIMNIMLVSVSERTTEVGLLKAIGARRRQILRVFLVEAVLLSGLGAAVGIVLGYALIALAGQIWPALPLQGSLIWTLVVLALALLAGALFGLMPAQRAARLPAVDALRGRL